MSVDLILMIVACVCLAAAALGVNVNRVQLGWAGLFFWALTGIV